MTPIISPFSGQDITALLERSRARALAAVRRAHAQRAPGCPAWGRFSVPAYRHPGHPGERPRMPVIGCPEHGLYMSL